MNNCGTCRHWHKDVSDEWGECVVITDDIFLKANMARIWATGECEDAYKTGLECTGEFGCMLWEAKDVDS